LYYPDSTSKILVVFEKLWKFWSKWIFRTHLKL